jgi:hypothetical protein
MPLIFVARKHAAVYPEAAEVIFQCFCVNDFVHSFNDYAKGLRIRATDIAAAGTDSALKTLSIVYDSKYDTLSLPVKDLGEIPRNNTEMLSETAPLHDPLG